MKIRTTSISHIAKHLRAAVLLTASLTPLSLTAGISSHTWIDGIGTLFDDDMDPMTPDVPDDNGSGNWDDITKWNTGVVPNGFGITVNFVNGYTDSNFQPRIRADQEPHLTDGMITVGILNFEDTAPDTNDTNFAYEGETDFVLLGNSTGSSLNFDNGVTPTIDGPAAQINFLNCFRAEVLRIGRDDLLSIDGFNGLTIKTTGNVSLDGPNFFTGPMVVRSVDSAPLSDLGDGSNTVPNAPDGTADGDGGGDGTVEVQHNAAFGATGPGNETVFMGDGGTDQFGDNNRKEGSLRFIIDDNGAAAFDPGVDPALDGSRPLGGGGNGGLTTGYTLGEEFFFRYFPAGDGVGARRIWEDAITVLDDVPVTLNGDIHFERGVDWNGVIIGEDALSQSGAIEEGDVRWEIQVGDTGTGSNARGTFDDNTESLTINGNIFINDQSGGVTEGRLENNLELNPVNVGSTLTINGAIGSNAAVARDADPGDLLTNLRYQAIFKNGDGTVTLGGDNEFDGNAHIQRGTLAVSNVGALDDAWVLRLGQGGTNPADELRFLVAGPGTFRIRDNGSGNGIGPIQLEDILGNPGATNPDTDTGNEIPYVFGMSVPGVAILDAGDTTYQGDGWNNSNASQELDNLDLTIELTAVAGAQLTYRSRIQGQLLQGDAIDPLVGNFDPIADLGTVTLNKTGDGTIILDPGGNQHQYSGPTNVLVGTLLSDGTLQKTTAINVSSGATFGGEGNIGDSTDADAVLDRATDGIDNDMDGFIDEPDETGLYYDSDGDPLTGPGNYHSGINQHANPERERPKVSVATSFADGADLELGLRDATQISQVGTLNLEGSVSFAGNNELRFNIGGPNNNGTGRDSLNVNNVNTAASPNGEIVFSGTDTETFVFAETPGLPIEARTYTILTTDNGFTGITLPAMGTGPAGFTYEVRPAGGNPNNIIVDVQVVTGGDTDGDGISDLLEDAFDTDKNDPASGPEGLPFVVTDGGVQKLRFRTLDVPGTLTYVAQQSTDAGDTVPWATVPGIPTASSDQTQATLNTTIMEVDINTAGPTNFGRVLVTE